MRIAYITAGAAGMDLRACIDGEVIIPPGGRHFFTCGFAFAVPQGYELQVRGRSGLAKEGVVLWGGVGTVDAPYRGAVGIALWNDSLYDFHLKPGERVAQGVIAPVIEAELEEVTDLDDTTRGASGFGSTGRK